MNFSSERSLAKALVLLTLFTGLSAHAVTETRMAADGGYQNLEHQFVLTPRDEVVAFCAKGDTLLKGECDGDSKGISDNSWWVLDYMQYLSGQQVEEAGQVGWSCHAKVIRPDYTVRISAVAKCKRNQPATEQSRQTKTPRNRGV